MTDTHTDRPNGGEIITAKGLHSYFALWLTNLEKFNDERDRRYDERHIADQLAVQSALAAAERAVTTALAAQEKAVAKAEASQNIYNQGHNDLLRKMDEQHKETLPRPEADARFRTLEEKIEDLRVTRGENTGSKMQSQWIIATFIAAVPTLVILADLLLRKP